MVSSRLKQKFEDWVTPRIRVLGSIGLTPNTVTALGLFSSFVSAWSYLNWRVNRAMLPIAGMLILLSGLFDALDGVLARTRGEASAFGGFLDSVTDRYSDAIVLMAVTTAGLCGVAWGLVAVIGSLMVSYTRARSEAAGVGMVSIGIAERAERMLLLAIVTIGAYLWLDLLSWGVVLLAIFSQVTVAQRILHFFGKTRNP
jgi:archaetidylinositol phosphate synthase